MASSAAAAPSPSTGSASTQPEPHQLAPQLCSVSTLLKCQLPEWYPALSRTIPSFGTEFVKIPAEAVRECLLEEGLVNLWPKTGFARRDSDCSFSSDEDDNHPAAVGAEVAEGVLADVVVPACSTVDDSRSTASTDSADSESPPAPAFSDRFPEFRAEMERQIANVGGVCFPKLNWSAPTDAQWAAVGGTLACALPEEAMLVLRNSDYCCHDLTNKAFQFTHENGTDTAPFDVAENAVLALREWDDRVHPALEFRCFVAGTGDLFAISQRDVSGYYPFLTNQKSIILEIIEAFFLSHGETMHAYLKNEDGFCADVALILNDGEELSSHSTKCLLVDVSPFMESTNPLLFETWGGVVSARKKTWNGKGIDFRVVTSQADVRADTKQFNSVPFDLLDFASLDGAEMLRKVQDIEQRQRREEQRREEESAAESAPRR